MEELRKRCAIYTRKSSQPPIYQDITSLEAQRIVCSSYIASQAHREWSELPKIYEDAGKSGANLDRPALKELLSDIEDGLVDVVLVYKMDRITRTLLDFVRLIDFFEKFGVTFVSITQNFDTGDSMGRLIRNILLTFAQFEREMASDRIKDKKVVMSRAGQWAGGVAPLGYDLKNRKLVINEIEAAAVRHIFEVFTLEKDFSAVYQSLLEQGFRRKKFRAEDGSRRGGGEIARTSIPHIIRNPVYIGKIRWGGEIHDGQHNAIVDERLWRRAQEVDRAHHKASPRRPDHILNGFVFDAFGRPMHVRKHKFRDEQGGYYESSPYALRNNRDIKRMRVSQVSLEKIVNAAIQTLLTDKIEVRALLLGRGHVGRDLKLLVSQALPTANRLRNLQVSDMAGILKLLLLQVDVGRDRVTISLRVDILVCLLRWDGVGRFQVGSNELLRAKRLHFLEVPVHLYRTRKEHWLPVEPKIDNTLNPAPALVEILEDAREAQRLLYLHRDLSITELAWTLGRKPASFARVLRLNYLAPDIVISLLDGTQPPHVDRRLLMKTDLPLDWATQRRILGFPSPT